MKHKKKQKKKTKKKKIIKNEINNIKLRNQKNNNKSNNNNEITLISVTNNENIALDHNNSNYMGYALNANKEKEETFHRINQDYDKKKKKSIFICVCLCVFIFFLFFLLQYFQFKNLRLKNYQINYLNNEIFI